MKNAQRKIKPERKLASKSFKATLERMPGNLGWTIVWIPFSVHKTWGVRGNFRIKGEINGFAFRTSLFPTRRGIHFLLVNKKMQAGAGVVPGTRADFFLQPDTAERVAVVPSELTPFLAEDASFRRWFEGLSYSYRKWFSDSITQLKSPASRRRRAEQIAEQLFSAMEAEHELPPALQLAFANEPRALEGWNRMSRLQRRAQLIAVFHYCSPDARARRLAKVIESAAAHAEKKSAI